jgi:co-chaperonin GroES (HSP10)
VIKPLRDLVRITIDDQREIKGSLLLVERSNERVRRGWVVSLGDDVFEVSQGDYVLFDNYKSKHFNAEDDNDVLVSEDNILGVFK